MERVVAADVGALAVAAATGRELVDRLRQDAATLDATLERVHAAPSEVPLAVPDLAGHLDHLATQWAELADDVGRVATGFREVDASVFGWLRLRLLLATVAVERRHTARPWQVDTRRVDDALARIRAALDPGGLGVRTDDLAVIRDTLDELDGAEADAVLGALSDEELAHWFGQLHDDWLRGGWSAAQRRELLVAIGEKVSLTTWRRLGQFTEEIDPAPRGLLADTAAPDAEDRAWFDPVTYEPIDGTLVATGPGDATAHAFDDVQQGRIGDCYLVAAMQALGKFDPAALADLVRPNPNGTFTVTFADGQQVVVSADLPVHPDRGLAFADNGEAADAGTELWPMLVEKAVAQRAGSWQAIVGGWQNQAVELLTGRRADQIDAADVSVADLAERFESGEILGLATIDAPDQDPEAVEAWLASEAPEPFRRGETRWDRLHPRHAFIVTGVDAAAGTVSVANPWNPTKGPVVLTEEELRVSVHSVQVNEARP